MTQEEKQLLLKDICARLHYGVKIKTSMGDGILCSIDYIPDGAYLGVSINGAVKDYWEFQFTKPYLRPMSSMSEKEKAEYNSTFDYIGGLKVATSNSIDFLNSHYLDYRGLIPLKLALKAKKGMYKTE